MEEVRCYFAIILIATAIIFANILDRCVSIFDALTKSVFQVASLITSTGFSSTDFNLWPQICRTVLVLIMFIGACAGSTGNYWRMEAGMNQTVRLGLSERLSYNLSGGLFFNQHNMYFADFSYFAKRYFPEPWGDRFGGIFHNLGGDWCNASDKYIQGHLMYESPFILLRFL